MDYLIIMRFVLSFIKVLKISRLFRQDQDQDFYFKTKTIFHALEAPRDQDQGLETTSLDRTLDYTTPVVSGPKLGILGKCVCLASPSSQGLRYLTCRTHTYKTVGVHQAFTRCPVCYINFMCNKQCLTQSASYN